MNWKAQINVVSATATPAVTPRHPMIAELRKAAALYAVRTDSFADGKAATCIDMAAKLERFGSFASEKQEGYAVKLIGWAKPRAVTEHPKPQLFPLLFAVMQKHSTFFVDALKISRRNQDSLCWLLWEDQCVGKLEDGIPVIWAGKCARAGVEVSALIELLAELNANPLEAAKKYGKLAGRCCSCGRDLTDPVSIEQGIGPTCMMKFSGA